MKKILFATMVCLAAALTGSAQTKTETGKFSIGVEAGLPVGDASDISNLAIGGSLKYEHPVAAKTFVSLSAGFTEFLYKGEFKDELNSIGISKSGEGFIPVKAGIKYYFNGGLFGEGQIGAVFSTENGGGTAFAYAPGIGYTFSKGLEAGVRYEGWSHNGTLSQLALRVAYRF
jgi:hypothetical protein